MKIKIYAIGHLKEPYLKQGINEYLERLKPYAQVEIVEVNDESIVNNPSLKEIEMAKEKECQRVIKLLRNEFCEKVKELAKFETEFAKYLEDKFVLGGSSISFVIGGSYGLSDELKKRCNDRIGLSNMTFLHQMTRLILLEQIYRAFKINRNEVYHK